MSEQNPVGEGNNQKATVLLSICIPTFNRAEYLNKALLSIVEQPGFNQRCEIVISDNHSTDNTKKVVEVFLNKYKNISYYCNATNIGAEKNFLRLLSLGQGKYLKLHNDKAFFYENKLAELIECLDQVDNSVVFILNENTALRKKGLIACSSFDEFVRLVSYYSTWMCGIILKNINYQTLKNKDRAIGSNLIQTDILFRMLQESESSSIINKKMLYEQEVESKGGYNLFEVFISNYLELYRDYLQAGILSQKTYHREKINLLRKFIFGWYTSTIVMRDKRYRFDVSKTNSIILKHYWNEPQLLLYPIYLLRERFKKLFQM